MKQDVDRSEKSYDGLFLLMCRQVFKCLMMIACLMGLAERDDAQLLELISYNFQLLVVVRKGEDTFTVLRRRHDSDCKNTKSILYHHICPLYISEF